MSHDDDAIALARTRLLQQRRREAETAAALGPAGALALDQVERARAKLARGEQRRLRFAQEGVFRISRYLVPGQFWVTTASTNMGKTPFLLTFADDLVEQGFRVAYMGLEQQDDDLRIALACMRAGLDRAIAIENAWDEHADGQALFLDVQRQLSAQLEPPLVERILLLPHRELTADGLWEAACMAAEFGADAFIIDHINHSEEGADYKQFVKMVLTAKRTAEEFDMVTMAAAQINRDGALGHRLTRFMPPQLQHMKGGSVLEENASGVLGLYWPLIIPASEAEKKRIEAAKKGLVEAREVLQSNRLGVMALKHRARRELVGQVAHLKFERGRLVDA